MKQPKFFVGASGKVVRDFEGFSNMEILAWIEANEQKPEQYTKLEEPEMNFTLEKLETLKRKIKHQTSRKDLKDFKKDAAKLKQIEGLRPTVLELLKLLKDEMDRATAHANSAEQKVLNHTAPPKPVKDLEAVKQLLEHQEIRDHLLKKDPKERAELVEQELKAGNFSFIHAVVSSPFLILSPETLNKLRRGAAPPEALANHEAAKQYITDTRKKCGELSGACFEALRAAGFERTDIVSEEEFFETFPPQSEYESVLVERRVQRQEAEQAKALRDAEWAARNSGMNLDPTPPPRIEH